MVDKSSKVKLMKLSDYEIGRDIGLELAAQYSKGEKCE